MCVSVCYIVKTFFTLIVNLLFYIYRQITAAALIDIINHVYSKNQLDKVNVIQLIKLINCNKILKIIIIF